MKRVEVSVEYTYVTTRLSHFSQLNPQRRWKSLLLPSLPSPLLTTLLIKQIAVEGCCHGELDAIYSQLALLESRSRYKVDLLLIYGDFEALRNHKDLQALESPEKYKVMKVFHQWVPLKQFACGGWMDGCMVFQGIIRDRRKRRCWLFWLVGTTRRRITSGNCACFSFPHYSWVTKVRIYIDTTAVGWHPTSTS